MSKYQVTTKDTYLPLKIRTFYLLEILDYILGNQSFEKYE